LMWYPWCLCHRDIPLSISQMHLRRLGNKKFLP
jgi:hypothetical protein